MPLFAVEIDTTVFIGLCTSIIVCLGAVIGLLYRAGQKAKDDQIIEMKERLKSYSEIAGEAVTEYATAVNHYRAKDGKARVNLAPPVISESGSPSTPKQRDEASIATLRATMAAIKEAEGLPAREEPPEAIHKQGDYEPVKLPPQEIQIIQQPKIGPAIVQEPPADNKE